MFWRPVAVTIFAIIFINSLGIDLPWWGAGALGGLASAVFSEPPR